MSSNPPRTKSVRIRHRIKEIELQPIRSMSKYPISVKVFVNDKEVCQLPPIEKGQDLRWSRPIVCRDASPQSKVTLEICEIHTIVDRSFKSQPYVISEVQDQAEIEIGFAGTEWIAKVTMLTPETVGQSHAEVLRQLKETELAPSALEKLGTAQKVLSAVLDFGNAVADAHPAAKLVFSISTVVWEKLKEENQLKGDTQGLLHGLTDIAELCEPVKKTTKMKQLKNIIDDILILLEDVFIYVLEHESSGSGGTMRALRRVFDSSGQEAVEELLGRYKRLRKQFNSGVGVDIHGAVYKIDLQSLLDKLQPVSSAGYNLDQACQHGTREEIIADVMDWTERPPSATPKPERMLWIHGQAGIGKSAIASSVCGKLKDTRTLAASFFCKRDGGSDLHDPLRLINTIAYSLANRCPEYAEAVAAAIEGNRELCMTNTLHERYEGLIDKPLQDLRDLAEPRPLIVIVDALDEFGTIGRQEELVQYLSAMSQLVPWLKIIVTSRPEGHIAECFQRQGDKHISSRNLHDFDASDDIRAYFQKELDKLAGRRGWKWPEGTVKRLSEKANGLFIWASTVKRHIEGSAGFKIAIERLNTVLKGQSKHRDLDKLYEQVIEAGMKDTDDDNRIAFCQCIGMIIAISTRRPLSLPALSSLLDGYVDPEIMDNVVNSLGAVIHVDRQMGDALRFYHQSFVDYATDRSRANSFYVNLGERNVELAEACLKVMEGGLKFNICGLETSDLFNSQILDLHERVESKISSRLNYSCVYWISHLTDTPKGTLNNKLDELLNGPRVLFWLEVLSLLGHVDAGIAGLLDLIDWIPNKLKDTRECVADLSTFTSTFYDAISASTPHLYASALALAPESALVVQRLKSSFPNTVVISGGDKNWPDWLKIANHPSPVPSVAVSPDGRRFVTSCGDGIIRLWDIRTGLKVGKPLVGHSDGVMSVAFSPKGDLIVSGSWDNTVRLWDAKACTAAGELAGHSGRVNSVAFSPRGDLIVSGSEDKTMRMWGVEKCTSIGEPLLGHSAEVIFVAFSPDGDFIISGSSAHEILRWDAKTLAIVSKLFVGDPEAPAHFMTSLALSPTGMLIAAGSSDCKVHIWNLRTGAPVGEPLEGHSSSVASIAFSPNDDTIVTGSHDQTIRIWDVKAGVAMGQPLVGHSNFVRTVAFSLEGDLIISGSLDNTVRIWDPKMHNATGEPFVTWSLSILSVAFSPDGNLIASASADNAVRMWDAKTCAAIGEPLVGHSDEIQSVAFSPGSDLIVSGSADSTIRRWHVQTHAAIGEPLVGHSSGVVSVAFSPNGDLIVSGSYDNTVRIWDIKTHASAGEPLVGHSDTVSSVAFSPDGNLIVSGSRDFTVRLWDAQASVAIGEPLIGHSDDVNSVAFSPGGNLIVSGSDDDTVRTWDVRTRAEIGEPLVGHTNSVYSVAFSPDGNLIVSGSADRTVRVWDVTTRLPIMEPLVGHLHFVQSVAFSPDGSLIVSGSEDGTLRVWDPKVQAPDPVEALRSPWPVSLTGLPPLSEHDGWASLALDDSSLLLWLPSHYSREYDPRAVRYAALDPAHSPILLDFSKFVHGTSWTQIASESFLREYM